MPSKGRAKAKNSNNTLVLGTVICHNLFCEQNLKKSITSARSWAQQYVPISPVIREEPEKVSHISRMIGEDIYYNPLCRQVQDEVLHHLDVGLSNVTKAYVFSVQAKD